MVRIIPVVAPELLKNLRSCNSKSIKIREMASASDPVEEKLARVASVAIDDVGRFKYILIKVYALNDPASSPSKEKFKYVVRGHADCPYHGDIYDRFVASLANLEEGGYDSECVGGGRIIHESKKISVFGYSQGYGKADHSITTDVLKKHYPSDYSISWNNDGY